MIECLIVWKETRVIFSEKEERAWVAAFVIEFIVIFLQKCFHSRHLHKKPSLTQVQYVPDNKSDCG